MTVYSAQDLKQDVGNRTQINAYIDYDSPLIPIMKYYSLLEVLHSERRLDCNEDWRRHTYTHIMSCNCK